MQLNRSSLPIGVGKLYKWNQEGRLRGEFPLPYQRKAGVWSPLVKSNLIWSILADSFIPAVVFLKAPAGKDEKGKDAFEYEILDGQQRLTTIFSFICNEFKLHSGTPDVDIDGQIFELAGLTFEELAKELQDIIQGYRFSIQCLENCSDEEAEALFYNINSGVQLSTIQKAKPKLGTDLISFLNEKILSFDFFTQAINITAAQARREEDLCILLQTMLLLDNMSKGYSYTSISTANCLQYAETIRGDYSQEKRETLRQLFEYLSHAFPDKNKFLRKNNAPIVAVIAQTALELNKTPEEYGAFINKFTESIPEVYQEASGSGNVKAPKVQNRLRCLFLEMLHEWGIEPLSVQKPFAEEIPLYVESDYAPEELPYS